MHSKTIEKLIELLSKFPTVGPRTATRFVFYLIKLPQEKTDELLKAIRELKSSVKVCPSCFNPFEDSQELCPVCRDASRDKNLLCIVEKETDLMSIEKTKKYHGLYFILGGTVNIKKKGKVRIKELKERIKNNKFKEIIIAFNPTTEGEATRLFIERELKPFNIKFTHLGKGLPVGGEVEYADSDTLSSALESRK